MYKFEDFAINKALIREQSFKPVINLAKKVDFIIDLHAHSGLANGLVFYNSVRENEVNIDPRRGQAGLNFIEILNKRCATFLYY